ncbi:hypothetical protein CASFOL_008024 [Castilleja foliolosa]|uniref:DNA-directed RNA polymerase III subunit RPC4 n=1 Tax=Castilleja foliolosa TaxID=1961234 RepID=A0ABD3DZ31_9LAMI
MDLDPSAKKVPRKVKFVPKAPPKREQKPVLPKVEKEQNDIDVVQAEQLLRRHDEALRGKPKVERKVAPVQVAFGYGGSSSTIKSYKSIKKNEDSYFEGGAYQTAGKEYKEPWDYYTSYPVTLPLRRPYSGNPELLDEEEFGEETQRSDHDENATNPAVELGLLDEDSENKMFFFQLPTNMPTVNLSANAEGNESDKITNPSNGTAKGTGASRKPCNLEALPAGLMGKMLVYKSGAVKLKLGEMIYDVSSGLNCVFAQDVAVVNTEEKHCCNVGELGKRVVITPDIDSMLDSMP